MPALKNAKHETFALGIFEGKSGRQAYLDAGYNSSPEAADAAASRLLKAVKVASRVNELRERVAKTAVRNKKWFLEEMEKAAMLAREDKQHSASIRALELGGREHNAFTEKKEIGNPGDFDDASDDELIDRFNTLTGCEAGSRSNSRRARAKGNKATLQ